MKKQYDKAPATLITYGDLLSSIIIIHQHNKIIISVYDETIKPDIIMVPLQYVVYAIKNV